MHPSNQRIRQSGPACAPTSVRRLLSQIRRRGPRWCLDAQYRKAWCLDAQPVQGRSGRDGSTGDAGRGLAVRRGSPAGGWLAATAAAVATGTGGRGRVSGAAFTTRCGIAWTAWPGVRGVPSTSRCGVPGFSGECEGGDGGDNEVVSDGGKGGKDGDEDVKEGVDSDAECF